MENHVFDKDTDDYLSSGLTLVNLALTDNPFCAFKRGSYNFIVGDSMTGKSWFSTQLFAEAAHDPTFEDYTLVFDQPEDGVQFDVGSTFGQKTAERIRPPRYVDEQETSSETVEEMYSLARKFMKKGPTIEIVDSMDALTSLAEIKKSEKIAEGIEEGEETKGIMSDGKAKVNSMMLRQLMSPLQKHKSLFFIISQTRDAVGNMFSEKTRSGGKALRFYATTELWFSVRQTLKKTVKGQPRDVGALIQIKVKKNRHSSQRTTIDVPLLHDYGFDDIGSCVDWLCKNHWKSGKTIDAPEFKVSLKRDALVAYIEDKESRYEKLKLLTGEVWLSIREGMKPKRKKRYV
jgi:hypothetical protein